MEFSFDDQRKREKEWMEYSPSIVTLCEGGDSHRIYVFADREPPEGLPRSTHKHNLACARWEKLINTHPGVWESIRQMAEKRPISHKIYTADGMEYIIPSSTLEEILRPYEEEDKRVEMVALERCWECGVTRILGRLGEDGRISRMPRELYLEAETARREAHQRSFEAAGGTYLATVGFQPTSSRFKFIVVSERYCGC